MCTLSHFSSVWLFAILWTVAHQAPLSSGFSRQEYWSRLPCPPPGDPSDTGIKPMPLCLLRWQTVSLPLVPPGKPEPGYRCLSFSPLVFQVPKQTKVRLVKAMAFPVVMYGCENWTIKKAERRRTDAFELWCWRRLLRVPWVARRSNQSILKEINPEYSLEGLMLSLKPQYFGHLMWRADSLEKILMLGKIEGRRRRGWQRMRWLDVITDSVDIIEMVRWQTPRDGEGRGKLMCCSPWGLKEFDVTKWLNKNQTENLNEASTNICGSHLFCYMLTLLC